MNPSPAESPATSTAVVGLAAGSEKVALPALAGAAAGFDQAALPALAEPAAAGAEKAAWGWLLSAVLLLLALLALPGQAVSGGQVLPADKAERLLPGEPALLSSQQVLRQWRRLHEAWPDAYADTPLDLPFLDVAPLLLAVVLLLRIVGLATSSVEFPSLPVVVRPGAPRGPPAGILVRL